MMASETLRLRGIIRKTIWKAAVVTSVLTTFLTLAVATLSSGSQRSLADRVDINTQRILNGQVLTREDLEDHRIRNEKLHYVIECILLTPPYPERTEHDLERCSKQAELIRVPHHLTNTPKEVNDAKESHRTPSRV